MTDAFGNRLFNWFFIVSRWLLKNPQTVHPQCLDLCSVRKISFYTMVWRGLTEWSVQNHLRTEEFLDLVKSCKTALHSVWLHTVEAILLYISNKCISWGIFCYPSHCVIPLIWCQHHLRKSVLEQAISVIALNSISPYVRNWGHYITYAHTYYFDYN